MGNLCDAFISYGRADSKAFATKLHTQLIEQGFKVWFDQNDIPLGVDFQNQIDDGIEKAHNFLFIIAPHSVNSPYCLKEIELAIKRNKRIIPLLHVMQISQEAWQQRNPNGTPEDWETYKTKGLHESYQNMHPTIRKLNWVYFQEGIDDFEKSFAGLLDIFERQKTYVYQHTYFLDKALEWQRNQQQSRYLLAGEEFQQAQAWLNARFKDEQPPCVPTDEHCEFITESIKNANNLMTQVFLSHAEEDIAVTEKIRRTLIRHGFTVWTNRTDIKTGTEFQEVINRGIEEADNLVYLISPNSLKSQYCQQEIAYASKLNKHIIPLLVEPTDVANIPIEQRSLQFIDFTEHDDETQYRTVADKLLNALKEDAWYYELHKILLVKALKWDRKDQPKTLLLKGSELAKAQNWLKQSEQSHKQTAATSLHKAFIAASEEMNQFFDVFISYGRADSLEFAIKLHARLVKQGLKVWFDKEDIPLGVDYQKQIDDGIEKAHNFLFIIAPHSINSPYCGKEIELALKHNKRIIPLLHVEEITQETWQQRNPKGTPQEWETYKAEGRHTVHKNMHPEIGKINWVNFREDKDDFEASLTGLLQLCERQQEFVQQHTYFLVKALKWDRKDQPKTLLLKGSELAVAQNWLKQSEQSHKQTTATSLHKAFIAASEEMNQFFDVFISYGRADSLDFAIKLHARLVKQGLNVWFDKEGIPLGVDYQKQIDDGIEKSHNFLFVIAPHSVNSSYCGKEIELALKRNKRIIPLLHVEQITQETWQRRNPVGKAEDWEAYKAKGLHTSFQNMHPEIGKINWVYFREEKDDFEASLTGLLKLCERQQEYVQQHTYFLAKALEWERNQKQSRYLLIGDERKQAETWLTIRFKDEQAPCLPTDLHSEFITESIKNGNNLMTQVFLAHAEEDSQVMDKIRKSLWRECFTVWTNKTDIQTGEAFEDAIKRGIEQADNVVYLLSPDSLNSQYCQQELEYALLQNKRIIPILVRETPPERMPPVLRGLHYIDLTDNVKEEDYQLDESQLLKILREDAPYYNEHKVLLTKALKWERQHRNPSVLLRGYNLRHAEAWLKVAKSRKQHLPTALQEELIAESLWQPPAVSLDVFVSYSRADSDFARKLNDALQMQGKTTWFDQESIASGADFQEEIYRGIESSNNFLFILSPRSINSPYCKDEVEYAAKLNKRFVTVLHRQVNSADLHPELAKVQWIDFNRNEKDFDANFRKLVTTLDTDREYVYSHTKWSQRALEWEARGKSKDLLLRGDEFAIAQNWLLEAENNDKQPKPTDLQRAFIKASSDVIAAKLKQAKRRVVILRSLLGLVSLALVFAIFQWRRAETVQEGQINALSRYSVALRATNQELDALVEAIRAGKQLKKQLFNVKPKTRSQVEEALRSALYEIRERNHLTGHNSAVYSLSFSPDGQMIATASADKTVKLWNRNGQELRTLKGHQDGIYSISFSPDGKTIATGSLDNTAILWNRSGQKLHTLKGHQSAINCVTFSPDGQIIATASGDHTVILWNREGKTLRTLTGHSDVVNSVTFSPDGQTIATASNDKTVKLWNKEGQVLKTLTGHQDNVRSVTFSPDGQTIATASEDKTVKLWNRNGQEILTLNGHNKWVTSVSFSPDGQVIATASDDYTVKLWNRNGQELQTLAGHKDAVQSVIFSPDGQTLATASLDKSVKLWNYSMPKLKTLKGDDKAVNSVSFSPDGQIFATAGADKTVKLWSKQGQLLSTLKGHTAPVLSVSFSSNGQMIASGSEDGTTIVWNSNRTRHLTLKGHTHAVNSVGFSPDGQILATASADSTVKLWSKDGQTLGTLKHNDIVSSVSFSPHGQTIATGSYDKTVKLWSKDGQELQTLQHDSQIMSLAWSPDTQVIAIASNDNLVTLWSRNGRKLKTLEHGNTVMSISFSPDGKLIATGGYEKMVKLWNREGQELQTLQRFQEQVNSVSFSPDGQTIAAVSEDKSVSLQTLEPERIEASTKLRTLELDGLLVSACNWVQDYLKYSSDVEQSDRHLCNGIGRSPPKQEFG